jgi:effector-binding domain-containing protein
MKKVLYVILGLAGLYLILAIVGPSREVVERKITIKQPVELVKKQLGDLKFFHEQWSPWTERDPNMTVVFTGNTGEVGHKMEWASEVDEVGQGTLVITAFNGDTIVQSLGFEGMGESKAYYIVTGNNDSSTVTWGLEIISPFLARPMMMFMNMDKMIGGDYETGLLKLKEVLESSKTTKYEVMEMDWPETNYVGSKIETVSFDKMSAFFGKYYSEVGEILGQKNIAPLAAPLAIFKSFDEAKGEAQIAAVFKVEKGLKLKGYENYTYPASKVLHIAYYGPYEKSAFAHATMDEYMKSKGMSESVVMEEYVTDPMSEKDSSKWLTNIYYLIK